MWNWQFIADRRVELVRLRVQTVNRLHRLLAELIPGQATLSSTHVARSRGLQPSR